MKQQLARILNSDITTYKVAVTQRIQNLQQIDQSLSQRSLFLQNFQEMLRKQMEKANLNCSSKIQDKPLPPTHNSPLKQSNYNKNQNKENKISTPNHKIHIQHVKKSIDDRKNLRKLAALHKNYFGEMRKHLLTIKQQVSLQINLTKNQLTQYFDNCVKNIVNKVSDLYEKRIQDLQTQINELKHPNLDEKQQLQQIISKKIQQEEQQKYENTYNNGSKNVVNKKLLIEIDESQLRQSGFQQQTVHQNNNLQVCQSANPYVSNQYYNSFQIRQNIKQSPCQFSFLSSSTIQIQNSMPDRIISQQPSYCYTNNLQKQQTCNMTLKNNRQTMWKHFTCDFSGGSSQQINSQSKDIGKKSKIARMDCSVKKLNFDLVSMQDQSYINLRTSKNVNKTSNQPNFPSLLRKNLDKQNYDIPSVRSLIVSYPPIEEGFSTLKLGNQIVYRGMWKYRKFHGKGKLMLPEYTYEGEFKNGLFDGRGILKLGNLQFIGEFKNNKVHGEGKLKLANKSISGKWRQNTFDEQY